MEDDIFNRKIYLIEKCCMCYEECSKDLVALKCGHVYHENCILQWFEKESNCPIDRVKISRKDLTKLKYEVQVEYEDHTDKFKRFFDIENGHRLSTLIVI